MNEPNSSPLGSPASSPLRSPTASAPSSPCAASSPLRELASSPLTRSRSSSPPGPEDVIHHNKRRKYETFDPVSNLDNVVNLKIILLLCLLR